MSGKYISQETAIKSTWMILEGMGYPRSENRSLERTVEAVFKSAPAADVVEVRHGRLLNPNPYGACSLCGRLIDIRDSYNYCPNCGAKMDDNAIQHTECV